MAVVPSRVFAALGGVALLAYFFVPASLAPYAYDAFGLASVAAVAWLLAGDRVQRGRGAWMLFAITNLLAVAGDLTLSALTASQGSEPFPSIADALYLAGYPLLAASILWAARLRGPTHDLVSLLDGILVAAAASVPVYVVWIAPALDGSGLGSMGAAVSVAYPVMDLLVIAAAVRFALGSGARSPAALMLGVGVLCTIASDVAYNVALLSGTYAMPDPIDAGWLAAYTLWGAAALHPSAQTLLEPGAAPHGVPLTSRTWILVAIVALPITVLAGGFVAGTQTESFVVIAPLAVMCATMILRLRVLARAGTRAWRAPAVLAAAAFLVVAVAVVLTEVHGVTQREERTADALAGVFGQAERVDAAAARALGGTAPAWLQSWEAQNSLWREIRLLAPHITTSERAELERATDRYVVALGRLTGLVARNRVDLAAVEGSAVVGPAREALITTAERLAKAYRTKADRTARAGRIGTVTVLLLALLLLTVLLLRFGGLSRAAQLATERGRLTRESERRFRALVEGSADILTVIDERSVVIAHPESVERVLGFPEGTMLGARVDRLIRREDAERARAALDALAGRPGASERLAFPVQRHDGTWFEAELSVVNRVDDPLLRGFVLNVRDVSDRKLLEAELEHQAFHDPLTGLPNRGLLEDRLRQALARTAGQPECPALVLFDVDDFRMLNDSLGHPMGDELLRQLAVRLGDCVRTQDTFARVGGDAFAVLVEDAVGDSDAVRLAERLVASLCKGPFLLDGQPHSVRASIGVATADPGAEGTVHDQALVVLRNAELAMYEAKRQDASSIETFKPHMHDAVTQRLELKAELRLALERDQFTLVYQPLVDIAKRRIVGYEALVRWIHPERGVVSPGEFIPVAEQTGLIVDLGTWVLREACRQLAEWQQDWPDTRYISVNVAGQQLVTDDLTKQVRDALRDAGLPPEQLLLEMTESSLIQDTERSLRCLSDLRGLGVRLAIDDFGTGYSSLSYLQRFSVDVLKIDKAFIDRITDDGPGAALVDAIVNMASSLHLTVVAEGIEEPEQVEALAAMRCGFGQGYHYARPLPVGDVPGYRLAPGPAAPVVPTPLRILQ